MKGSVKLFIASLLILACSVGFFLGSICNRPCPKKGEFPPAEAMMEPPHDMQGGPGFKKGPQGPGPHQGFDKHQRHPNGPQGPMGMGPECINGPQGPDEDFVEPNGAANHGFKKAGPSPEEIDSIIQITQEQKIKLDRERDKMDSTFKELRKQKHKAEKDLQVALDENNEKQIAISKNAILKAQEAMLDTRIAGAKNLGTVLNKEQLAKFKDFHKNEFKKKNKDQKKGPKDLKDPKDSKGPKMQNPPKDKE